MPTQLRRRRDQAGVAAAEITEGDLIDAVFGENEEELLLLWVDGVGVGSLGLREGCVITRAVRTNDADRRGVIITGLIDDAPLERGRSRARRVGRAATREREAGHHPSHPASHPFVIDHEARLAPSPR